MKGLRSLQSRLAMALVAGLTCLWVAATVISSHVLTREIEKVSDSALQEMAQRLLPLAVLDILGREEGVETHRIAAVRPHEELLTYVARDKAGKVVLQSHDADAAIFPKTITAGFASSPSHRFYTEIALQGTISLTIAEPLRIRQEAVENATGALKRLLLLLIPIGMLGTWAIVRIGLRPIRDFCSQIQARGRRDLAPLDGAKLPLELSPIAEAVNALMTRLERTLAAERGFSANSAHEMRTPVAAALAQTQRLVAELKDPAFKERAKNVEASLRALSRLSEKLMQLARAEDGRIIADTPQDIRPALKAIVEDIQSSDAAGRLVLQLPKQEILSRMDMDAFAILARNLIENAVKHGAPDHPIQVVLTDDGTLSVTNRGDPLPVDMLERLTKPFERGAATAKGSGLGLAIVDAIARGASAHLAILSPAPGLTDGFQASVQGLADGDNRVQPHNLIVN